MAWGHMLDTRETSNAHDTCATQEAYFVTPDTQFDV